MLRGRAEIPAVLVRRRFARRLRGHLPKIPRSREGDDVGKEARIALLLAGSACLMAVMFDWIVSELQ
jgi:hypothetical protein